MKNKRNWNRKGAILAAAVLTSTCFFIGENQVFAGTVVGGLKESQNDNIAKGDWSIISGGDNHSIYGSYSSISGGSSNTIGGDYSSISGGYDNWVPGDHGAIEIA